MPTTAEIPVVTIMNVDCPSRVTLEVLSDKWVLLIVVSISRGNHRNGQLLRRIGGISQKMLTQTLRKLEASGVVARTVYDQVPPHVEYNLTPLGESLLIPIQALADWAECHYSEVQAVRQDTHPRELAQTHEG